MEGELPILVIEIGEKMNETATIIFTIEALEIKPAHSAPYASGKYDKKTDICRFYDRPIRRKLWSKRHSTS